jgi:hypothetical protein
MFIDEAATVVLTKHTATPAIEININDGTVVLTIMGTDGVMPALEMKEEPT